MATNITWHPSLTHDERAVLRKQKGFTLWFTGLSASGKSTIATTLEQYLLSRGLAAYRLDGDNVRFGLNQDLGFSERDRGENIRRISESCLLKWALGASRGTKVAVLFADSCTIALTSFISPYRADRLLARTLHNARSIPFLEIYVHVPIEVAEARDPKGLYAKARRGEIQNFTGVSAPYEEPEGAEIVIKSGEVGVEDAVRQIVAVLEEKGLLDVANGTKAKVDQTATDGNGTIGGPKEDVR